MKENKVGTYSFVAEPFHVDFTGRLFMGVLGNHLLNCAGFHATERGFGMAELNESNYTWVLSRLAIELEDMPAQYEEFSVDTWVENVYRLFTDRNFAIYGKDGKVYGYARSVWAMINMDTRKPADLLSLHGGDIVDYIETEKACPIEKPGRIKVSSCMPVRSMDVYYSDIDINGHVNNIRYADFACDAVEMEGLPRDRFLCEMQIGYLAECRPGDLLTLQVGEQGEGRYVRGIDAGGNSRFEAALFFGEVLP